MLSTLEVLISRTLIESYINLDEFEAEMLLGMISKTILIVLLLL